MDKIKGYRDLGQEEVELINEGKALAEDCRKYLDKIGSAQDIDKRSVALGRTNLQQGFMWAIRAIARPETF